MGEKVEDIESMNLEKNGSDHKNVEKSGSFEGGGDEKVEKLEETKDDIVKSTNLEKNGNDSEKPSEINGSFDGGKGGGDEKVEKQEETKDDGIKTTNMEKNGNDSGKPSEINGSFEGVEGGGDEKVEKQEETKDDEMNTMNLEKNGDDNENLIGINGSYEGVKGGGDEKVEKREETKDDEMNTTNLEKNGDDNENLIGINGSYEGVKGVNDEKVESREEMKDDGMKSTNLEGNGNDDETSNENNGSFEGVKGFDEKVDKRDKTEDDVMKSTNLERNGNDDENSHENDGSNEGVKGFDDKMEETKDGTIETMNLESIGNDNLKSIANSKTCEGIKGGGDDEVVLTDKPKDDLIESTKNGNSIGINGPCEGVKGGGDVEVEISEEPRDDLLETMKDGNLLGINGSHEGVKDGVNNDLVESKSSGNLGNGNKSYEAVIGGGDDEVALGEKPKNDTTDSTINENLIVVNGPDEGVKGGLKDDLVETKNSGISGSGNEDMMNNGSYDGVKSGDYDEVATGDKLKDDESETLDSGKLVHNSENLIGIDGSGEGVKGGGDDEKASREKSKSDQSEKLGNNNENLTGTNESYEDGKGDVDNEVVSGKKPNDDHIETMSSGNFGNNTADIIGRSESYGGVMGGNDDEVSPEEKPKYDNTEKLIGINGSYEGVKVGGDDEVASGENPKDDPNGKSPSSMGAKKGKGLRKWRRIKRDDVKEGSGSVDSSKPLKRGMPTSGPMPNRQQMSDCSLSSTGARVENFGKVVGPADSGNSRDRSSTSSTMASTRVNGVHQGKAQVKNTKKARGQREQIEKESSISSLESDSRSSNFVFVQGADSMTSNGRQKEKVADHDGDNSDVVEAQDGEKCDRSNKVGADISKENGDLADAENQTSAPELDPLAKSISELQSAQEALEKELQKLREWGDESQETTDEEIHEASSSRMFTLGENTEIHPHYLKKHVNTLKQDADFSESRLEEVNAVLNAKKTNVMKLEDEEIEAEIEDLFKHKLEAEFQFLAISRAVEKWKTDVVDQVALSDELETTLNVVRDAQGDVSTLKRQTEKLETRVKDTIEIEQVSKLQKRVCQVTSCLSIQLILLLLVVLSFVSQLPPYDEVVPT